MSLLKKVTYKRDLYSAKETYILKEPTNHSHSIRTHGHTSFPYGVAKINMLLKIMGFFCRISSFL